MSYFKNILLLLIVSTNLMSQNYNGSFGEGLKLKSKDESLYLKFNTRIQTRWDVEYTPDKNTYANHAQMKRARLKFSGYFINPNLRYKIEYDVVGGYVRDGLVKYKINNFDFWAGQGKLPGNRERLTSSANLQLVDRSIFNKNFNLDRDVGIQMHHHFYIGNMLIRDIYAISSGNGILDNKMSEGYAFTGKIEILPFGKFTKKGDYVGADIYRENKPKLSIAAYTNYNKSAYKSKGTIGKNLGVKTDLLLFGADFIFKYKGYSLLTEYAERNVKNATENTFLGYSGYGLNTQSGYVFKNMWEISGRYSFVRPTQDAFNEGIDDYTIGVSKYFMGHSFKIQSDITYRKYMSSNSIYIYRIQMEFQI